MMMKYMWCIQLKVGRVYEGGVTLFLISIYYEFPLLAAAGCRTLGWMDF